MRACLVVLLLAACGRGAEPVETIAGPPILFVSIDTLAARHLALHGYDRETAPNLTAFAREAVVFDGARANAPWTVPSYLSQMTGLYPGAHELPRAPGDPRPDSELKAWERHRLAPGATTLAARLADAGYATAGFYENPWLGIDALGIGAGFETWRGPGERHGLAARAGDAIAWLDQLRERQDLRPWFLFVQSTEPHAPYEPPPRWSAAFTGATGAPRRVPLAPEDGPAFGTVPPESARGATVVDGAVDAEALIAAYDAEILAMDAAFGALLEALRRRGVLERAIVVFTADHGESMTEHGFFFGHGLLYDEHLRVPLLVRLPGGAGGTSSDARTASGRRVPEDVQLVDLAPTLLELARVDGDPGAHGRSLARTLEGRSPGDAGAASAFADGGVQRQAALVRDGFKLIESRPWTAPPSALASHPALTAEQRAELAALPLPARAARAEAFLGGPRYELFDLATDPGELLDLAPDPAHAARLARMIAELDRERARAATTRAALGSNSPAVPGAGDPEIDPAALAELERLGYAGRK